MPRIGVIADDLTGAMDSGLQFGKRGIETLVPISWERLPEADVIVVDTETREASASVAYGRLRRVASHFQAEHVYKKVDSTMRGNVGFELRALSEVLQPRGIVIAPAFPANGRTTLRGHQLVEGKPLELTFFAHDPRWPMRESHLPTLLMEQAGADVGLVGLAVVERGPEALIQWLASCADRYVVVDAVSDGHLAVVAEAVVRLEDEWLPCGSAGLAAAWADALHLVGSSSERVRSGDSGPVLVVAGSRNDATRHQLAYAVQRWSLKRVDLDVGNLWSPEREMARVAAQIMPALSAGRDAMVTATFSPLAAGREALVADLLGAVVAEVAEGVRLGGLFATGGDVSIAVCRALGVQALRIVDEVQAGVPGGRLVGGGCAGLRVVTKAGGFGDQRVLLDALAYLHGAPAGGARQ